MGSEGIDKAPFKGKAGPIIEALKKEKLHVKDQLYTLLRKADVASA